MSTNIKNEFDCGLSEGMSMSVILIVSVSMSTSLGMSLRVNLIYRN